MKNKHPEKKTNTPAFTDQRSFMRKIALVIFLFTLVLYGNTLNNKYALDDEYVVYNNPLVQKGIKAIPEIFTSRYAMEGEKATYGYRPLVKTTFAIEYQLFGERPAVSHFLNLLLYAATGILLFIVLSKLFRDFHRGFSLLVVLLFLVHPLHTEVVASLKNRDELLSFFFALWSMLCAIRYVDKKQIRSLVAMCLLMAMAMLSKPSALTFIALIPLALYYFTEAKWKELITVTALLLVGLGLTRLLVMLVLDSAPAIRTFLYLENPLYIESSIGLRLHAAIYTLFFYMKMFFVPHPLLSYYGYNQVPVESWSNPLVLLVVVIVIATGAYALYRIRKKEVWSFAVLFVLVALSMYLNLVIPAVGIVAERFAYVATLGFCIFLGWLFYKIADAAYERNLLKQLNIKWSIAAIVVLFFSVITIGRNPAWKDHYTLYTTDIQKAPRSAKLHALLAAKCAFTMTDATGNVNRRLLNEAIKNYNEAIDIFPRYSTSLNNLGLLYYLYERDTARAIQLWSKAIEADTSYKDAYFNLASAENALGRYPAAEKHYMRVIALDPDYTKVYTDLGMMYARTGHYDNVLEMSNAALKAGVVSDVLYINIGNVMLVKGDTLSAAGNFEKAVSLNPKNPGLCRFLEAYYARQGDVSKADHFRELRSAQ